MRQTDPVLTDLDPTVDFCDFITASPSSYHAAAEILRRCRDAGFREQVETDPFDATPGGHVLIRDGAALAYRLPAFIDETTTARIVVCHTDSPGFKLKPNPTERHHGYAQAGMEVYGGPLLPSWLDREFGLAGRVVTRQGESKLVETGPWLRIPALAIHLDRSANESLHLDQQRHLLPVTGLAGDDDLLDLVAEAAGLTDASDIAGHDLFAATTEPPARIGRFGDLLATRRLDNLSSVWSGLDALLSLGDETVDDIVVLAAFDHEEIGSATRSGAQGPLLGDLLDRILTAAGVTGDDHHRLFARSWVISADAGHAGHPNYPERFDPVAFPLVNGGPLLKVNAKQRYASDAHGAALWTRCCETAEVPHQVFVSNNAVPCGTTVGPLTATRTGLRTVDVGIGLLSMHSARELCGVEDPAYLSGALAAFYRGA
ncbi:MAG: M18 family aminopeptidase [Propionibacteriaceae bacterium]|jgi:aspartyl aminopeptidase|nr:M18 family aminopeptidase [Propionibacteriaceae bacterium]